MTHTRYAFVKANWHADILSSLEGFAHAPPLALPTGNRCAALAT